MAEQPDPGRTSWKAGEVCRIAGIAPYVLRYWEGEFPALAAGRSAGAGRSYSREELDLICRIKRLLYDEGYTIAGARKKLEQDEEAGTSPEADGGREEAAEAAEPSSEAPPVAARKRAKRAPRAAAAPAFVDSAAAGRLNDAFAVAESALTELEAAIELLSR